MSKIDIFFPLQYSSHGLVQLETFLEKKYFWASPLCNNLSASSSDPPGQQYNNTVNTGPEQSKRRLKA